jgi:AcrR family transcriptional regulator
VRSLSGELGEPDLITLTIDMTSSTTKRLPAEKRKKQILRSAITVFARSTYHGATTKSISEQAGVTEALIYRYFGSKRDLFTAAIHLSTTRIVEGLEQTLTTHRDEPLEAIPRCFQYYVELLERSEDFAKMIFLVLSELDQPDVRQAYLPYQERALRAIANTIRHWQQIGFVSKDMDIKTAAWLFFGTYLILALVKHSHGTLPVDVSFSVEMAKHFLERQQQQDAPAS